MIHPLPDAAQITDGDHVRVRRLTYHHNEGKLSEVQVEVEYGTVDADDNFQPRDMTPRQEVIIRDVATFEGEAFERPSPSNRGDPVAHGREAALGFIDNGALWPTQGEN